MPKLGSSLAATTPALVKFGAKFIDKAGKLEKNWRRAEEWAPVLTGVAALGMMHFDAYPDEALAAWNGSISIVSDQLLSGLFEAISRPAAKGTEEAAPRKERSSSTYDNIEEVELLDFDKQLLMPRKIRIHRHAEVS